MIAPAKAGKFTLYGAERQGFAAERAVAATQSHANPKTLWRGGLPPLGCAAAPKHPSQPQTPWRGSLLPLGCVAAPIPAPQICQAHRSAWFSDCYAAEREQAPSPQKPSSP
ncbi:hypothetical protein EYC95_01295 [Pseudomonas sp. BGI-2]|nr:hypothetical protein EYC95_01295 [Pseudomonas sp. BGI-2]